MRLLRQLRLTVDVERIAGWRCIGCGRVDAPRPCVGVCQDRRCDLVTASDYDAMRMRCEAMEAVLALIARVTPREEEWQASWHALQRRARDALGEGASPRGAAP